jgi:hypothetical protein
MDALSDVARAPWEVASSLPPDAVSRQDDRCLAADPEEDEAMPGRTAATIVLVAVLAAAPACVGVAQVPNDPGLGDSFNTNTALPMLSGRVTQSDPVRCFDHALRDEQNALQAYQVVYGPNWESDFACEGDAAAPELGPCWASLLQAKPLIEQAARTFEEARRVADPASGQMVKQASAMLRQANDVWLKARACFAPVFAKWTQNGGHYVAGGDTFNVNPGNVNPGNVNPGGGGLAGEPAIGQYGRDPECGGTNRVYYDRLYGSTAMVLGADEAQRLYRATQGQIWQRCGACGARVICWPRQGFDQFLAQARSDQPSTAPPPAPSPFFWEQPADAATPPATKAAADILRQWNAADPRRPVTYAQTTFDGQKLHAVKVTGRIAIDFDPKGKTLQDFVAAHPGASGAVTGTFSGYPNTMNVGGPVVQNGKLIAPPFGLVGGVPPWQRSFLGNGPRGFFVTEVGPFANNAETAKSLAPAVERLGADQGLGGLGRLLDHGSDVHKTTGLGTQHFSAAQISDGPNARAVAGVSGDGRTLMLLVEEGNGQAGTGAGVDEMAQVLRGLGASDAVIMDSGGSAQIFLPSANANNRPNDARRLPTAIVF